MNAVRSISIAIARCAFGFALSLSTAPPLYAADWSYKVLDAPSTFTTDVGFRIWYGHGKTAKNLYDTTGTELVSRLTYDGLNLFTGEGFTRFDFNTGWFVKGMVGGGGLWDGKLKDEDFPPAIDPYSATLSGQDTGSLIYGTIDAGFKLIRGPDFHVGAFAGYQLMREVTNAFGCVQVASNPFVCPAGLIPNSIQVISQTNNWHSLRLGLDASVELDRRWIVSVDAAYIPYLHLSGSDSHRLRIGPGLGDFTGPLPEDGNGWGYQIEGSVSYRINEAWTVGLGGRYWHMEADGFTHFENHVVGFVAAPQVLKWKTDNFGAFFQSSFKFGPYPVFSTN